MTWDFGAASSGLLLLVTTVPIVGIGAVPQEHALSERAAAIHLLQRATFSARPADVDAVVEMGRDAWLDRQLHPDGIADSVAERSLARLPDRELTPAELAARYQVDPSTRARLADTAGLDLEERRRLRAEVAQGSPSRILGSLVSEKLVRATWSERQLQEVMTEFWFDHFNVFWGKGPVRYLVGDYERNAIRPNVFGRFEDLLMATARHPAMLLYLDNARSVAPQIQNERRRRVAEESGRLPGLNENYARELLELHTLGVDAGYSQDDVIEVARAFTGWGVVPPVDRQRGPRAVRGEPLSFVFREELHDPEDKVILGTSIPGGAMEEGEAVLELLAHDPATARHVARQLAVAFVSDEPPSALIDDVAMVFQQTGGDLREVTRALFTHDRFFDEEHLGARVKSPFRLIVSALRATDARFVRPQGTVQTLRQMGNMPYLATVPTGYPEESAGWGGAGTLLDRSRFALDFASGTVAGLRVDAAVVEAEALATFPGETAPTALARLLVPGADAEDLGRRVAAGLRAAEEGSNLWNDRMRAATALGLLLAAPEFQRH